MLFVKYTSFECFRSVNNGGLQPLSSNKFHHYTVRIHRELIVFIA